DQAGGVLASNPVGFVRAAGNRDPSQTDFRPRRADLFSGLDYARTRITKLARFASHQNYILDAKIAVGFLGPRQRVGLVDDAAIDDHFHVDLVGFPGPEKPGPNRRTERARRGA